MVMADIVARSQSLPSVNEPGLGSELGPEVPVMTPSTASSPCGDDSYKDKYKSLKRKYKDMIYGKVEHDRSLKRAWDTIHRLRQEKEMLLDKIIALQDQTYDVVSDSDDSIFTEIQTVSTATSLRVSPPPPMPPPLPPTSKTESAKKKKAAAIGANAGSTTTTPKASKASSTPKGKPGPKSRKPKIETPQQSTMDMAPTTIVGSNSKRHTKPKRLKKPSIVSKTFRVPKIDRDIHGQPNLPMQIGILTLHSLGSIVYDRRDFHNERYIFPVGYKVTRMYHSMISPKEQVLYTCWISDGGDSPRFHIEASDQPDKKIIAGTATGAWTAVVKEANTIRLREHSNSASGPDYFGFSQLIIRKLIQELPNADKCTDYIMQEFIETDKGGRRRGQDDKVTNTSNIAQNDTSSIVDDNATLPSRQSSIETEDVHGVPEMELDPELEDEFIEGEESMVIARDIPDASDYDGEHPSQRSSFGD